MLTAFYENNEAAGRQAFFYTINCQSHYFPLHFHREEEIYFVRKGTAEVYVDGKYFQVGEGDIVAILPGQIHGYHREEDTVLAFVRIDVNIQDSPIDFIRIRFVTPCITSQNNNYYNIEELFEKILHEDAQRDIGYLYMIRSYADQLAAILLRTNPYQILTEQEAERNYKNMQILGLIDEYLSNHYHERIALDQIAAQCAMSKCYFSRYFHSLTGQCFIHYLRDYRSKKAQELLVNSNKSITEIAYESGFSNLRSLHRGFVQMFGVSPAEYRKLSARLNP